MYFAMWLCCRISIQLKLLNDHNVVKSLLLSNGVSKKIELL